MNPDVEPLLKTDQTQSAAQLQQVKSCAQDLFRNDRFSISDTTVLSAVKSITIATSAITTTSTVQEDMNADKKPSYLNLACSVNGYSNLTTYDSKIRQDLNKSREVSPIRPSTSSMPYCKKSNALTPPVVLTMSNIDVEAPHLQTHADYDNQQQQPAISNNNNLSIDAEHTNADAHNTSFVKQRIERLYGPGALAQGFYSPRKQRMQQTNDCTDAAATKDNISPELAQKFKQLSPRSQNYVYNKERTPPKQAVETNSDQTNGNAVDLPVLRHLSKQFRAQLPAVTPKKVYYYGSPEKQPHAELLTTNKSLNADELDHQVPTAPIVIAACKVDTSAAAKSVSAVNNAAPTPAAALGKKDANYFLDLLHSEQQRLLKMAELAEAYLEQLKSVADVSEDTLGFLRSAAGKARLLVNQKMKQFEGLCHINLKGSPDEQFPTTIDDLQGFWDMVYLQVDHLDAIFMDVEKLKNNNWQKPVDKVDNGGSSTVTIANKASTATTATTATAKTNQSKTSTVSSNKCIKSNKSNASNAGTKPKATTTKNGAATNGNKTTNKAGSSTTAANGAAAKREAQRKQLMEFKRANKNKLANAKEEHKNQTTAKNDSIEIFVSTTPKKS